jgi:protein-histidine N-methyltransferase
VADYNPTVLQLVTLPNFLLAWALCCRETTPALKEAFNLEDELELSPEVLAAFQTFLTDSRIDLHFVSGGWSQEFIEMLYNLPSTEPQASSPTTLILGAETIYSPFALQAFTETVFTILEREQKVPGTHAAALIGAKRLYFGVGGSLDDFIEKAESKGGVITRIREETEGVRRGVVRCALHRDEEATTNT